MTFQEMKDCLKADDFSGETLERLFAFFLEDAGGDCAGVDDYLQFCYQLLLRNGPIADRRAHDCAFAYIAGIENRHPEYTSRLYSLYNREGEYFTAQNIGTESLYYAGKLLEAKNIPHIYYVNAITFILEALANARLTDQFRRYYAQMHELIADETVMPMARQLLAVSLMDCYSINRELDGYLEAARAVRKIEETLEEDATVRPVLRLHLTASVFSFPELYGQKTDAELIGDFRACVRLLEEMHDVLDTIELTFLPMLEVVRPLMDPDEFAGLVLQIIASSRSPSDRIAMYEFLVGPCAIRREAYPEVYERYLTELRAYNASRNEARRQSVEVALIDQDLQRKYKYAALVDRLTGVYSRYAYQEELAKLTPDPELTFFVIDINRLKYFNDTYGHEKGDQVLIRAAERLTECFRGKGRIYRYGGDEFYVIARCSDESLREAADFLKRSGGEAEADGLRFALSVGYARAADHPDLEIAGLIRLADADMYADKNQYYIRNGLDRRSRR